LEAVTTTAFVKPRGREYGFDCTCGRNEMKKRVHACRNKPLFALNVDAKKAAWVHAFSKIVGYEE
jgi:hypothetical protein